MSESSPPSGCRGLQGWRGLVSWAPRGPGCVDRQPRVRVAKAATLFKASRRSLPWVTQLLVGEMQLSLTWVLPLWVLLPSLGPRQCPCHSCSCPGLVPHADFPPKGLPFPKWDGIESDPSMPSLSSTRQKPAAVSFCLKEECGPA